MARVLGTLVLALILTIAGSHPGRADDPLPENATLDGLYPVEEDILDAIDDIAPDLAENLRDDLPKGTTFYDRARTLDKKLGKYKKKIEKLPATDPYQIDALMDRLLIICSRLILVYGFHDNEVQYLNIADRFSVQTRITLEEETRRAPRDMSALRPEEKQILLIPLTPEDKERSGLDDLTPIEKAEGDYPLTEDEIRFVGEEEERQNRMILYYPERVHLEEMKARDQESSAPPAPGDGNIRFRPRDVDGGDDNEGGHGDDF